MQWSGNALMRQHSLKKMLCVHSNIKVWMAPKDEGLFSFVFSKVGFFLPILYRPFEVNPSHCFCYLGHSYYIVWSTSSDKGGLYLVGGKKNKNKNLDFDSGWRKKNEMSLLFFVGHEEENLFNQTI